MTGGSEVLSGLRIVEVSAFVAAPFAGTTLAALGADVIRVEQLGGGVDARRWPLHGQRSLYRDGLDRGKRLLEVDLRTDQGRALVHDLVATGGDEGGIVLTNLPTRGWLSFDSLRAIRPDVILVTILGQSDGRPAVDYTVNASVGFPLVTGQPGVEEPVNHVLPAWDIAAGLMAATALLAAERHRRNTGEGQVVELALADVATAVVAHLGYVAEARLVAEPRPRFGNYVYGTLGRDFVTRDRRRVMVCALTPRQWRGLAEATGLGAAFESLADEVGADLADEGSRFEHREAIASLLEPWFGSRTVAEIGGALDEYGVLWGPYRTFQEFAADELVTDRFASPVAFGAFARAPAPDSAAAGGSASSSILRDRLDVDEATIARLRAEGIIDAG